jgi:hypothetical protein
MSEQQETPRLQDFQVQVELVQDVVTEVEEVVVYRRPVLWEVLVVPADNRVVVEEEVDLIPPVHLREVVMVEMVVEVKLEFILGKKNIIWQ